MTHPSAILPTPSPAAVLAARESAGHTQAEAAALVGLADRRAWWRIESGATAISPAAWALYLLATGQHPALELSQREPARPPRPA